MTKIKIEIDGKYREELDMLKGMIPKMDGSLVEDDSELIEILIDSLVSSIEDDCSCGEECGCGNNCECSDESES